MVQIIFTMELVPPLELLVDIEEAAEGVTTEEALEHHTMTAATTVVAEVTGAGQGTKTVMTTLPTTEEVILRTTTIEVASEAPSGMATITQQFVKTAATLQVLKEEATLATTGTAVRARVSITTRVVTTVAVVRLPQILATRHPKREGRRRVTRAALASMRVVATADIIWVEVTAAIEGGTITTGAAEGAMMDTEGVVIITVTEEVVIIVATEEVVMIIITEVMIITEVVVMIITEEVVIMIVTEEAVMVIITEGTTIVPGE